MSAIVPLTPAEKISVARQLIKKKWPYIMSTVHGLIPRPTDSTPTMCVTPGMVMGYNKAFVESIDLDQLAAEVTHEAMHVLRDFFGMLEFVDDAELFNVAADIPINDDMKAAGWKTGPDWVHAETFGFPKGLTTLEYFDLLRQMKQKNQSKLQQLLDKLCNEPGTGGDGQKDHNHRGVGKGGCGLKKGPASQLDNDKDEEGRTIGRGAADKKRLIRQTLEETKQHMEQKGRGSVPSFMAQLVDLEMKPSRIPWRDRIAYVIRETTGPIISGGDDYSMRHPSKRSYVRKIMRPGLIDCLPNVLFIIDTSGSMSERQMRDGADESAAVLSQLGIDEGYLCQVDAAVAEEPRKITLAELSGAIQFKGRGGTDFGPGFRAAMRMFPRPDLIIYMTDGDGYAPRTPCPIPTIWGIVPRSHYTRRPAPWGYVVTITDNEAHPDDEEENFQPHLVPPVGYQGWGDGIDEPEEETETDPDEYEEEEEDLG